MESFWKLLSPTPCYRIDSGAGLALISPPYVRELEELAMVAYNASMATVTNELTQRQQEEAAQAAATCALKQPAHKFPRW